MACFADNGFHETTVQDIYRRAGLSAGAVYRYFPSKEAIIEAAWRRDQQARQARYSLARQQGDTRSILEYLLTVYAARRIQPEEESRMRFRVQLLAEALRNPHIREKQRLHLQGIMADLSDIIRCGQDQGEINPDLDAEMVAGLLVSLVDGLYVHKALDPGLDVEAYANSMKGVFFGHFWVDSRREGEHGDQGGGLHTETDECVPRRQRAGGGEGRQPGRADEAGLPGPGWLCRDG
jgi:AcrR family transcriptional regulator